MTMYSLNRTVSLSNLSVMLFIDEGKTWVDIFEEDIRFFFVFGDISC